MGLNPTLLVTGDAKSAPSVQIWRGTRSQGHQGLRSALTPNLPHPRRFGVGLNPGAISDWRRQICPIHTDLAWDLIPLSFVIDEPRWLVLQVPVAEHAAAVGEVAVAKEAVAKARTLRSQGRHQR